MSFSDYTYGFFNISELDNIDYSQVFEENSIDTRRRIDNTQFCLTWNTTEWPSFVSPSGSINPVWIGTHNEFLNNMTGSLWVSPNYNT